MMYYRPTTAYLEKAMHNHFAKAADPARSERFREVHRMMGEQLEAVVNRDCERAKWHGKHRKTA